jgi:2,3-bisphosphoglycerate-independent phosphoglycerate mutase
MTLSHRPTLLLIFDGFGHSDQSEFNAICQAKMPCWDALLKNYPHRLISGSGCDVGLPDGQMGNSEVGHLNMGAGRVVAQDLGRINEAIETGSFFANPVLTQAVDTAIQNNKAIHILGLLSEGGVHSQASHITAMLQLAADRGATQIYLHPFLDGRDTPPRSALSCLQALENQCETLGVGTIASVCGRFYAMDRDSRWDRSQAAFDLLTLGKASNTPLYDPNIMQQAASVEAALHASYARNESDEFVKPTAIHALGASPHTVQDGDVLIFMNYRSDRVRQLSRAFLQKDFAGFIRQSEPKLSHFVSLTQYADDIPSEIAYAPQVLKNILGEVVSTLGLKQLRIAETEKYAHVTFFFNGGIEAAFKGEDRILVPSPKVATYDLKPEMSAPELTDKLVAAIASKAYDLIICNYANADMVGHTGNIPATILAIEALDTALSKIMPALQAVGGEALITADHGNAECMYDPATKQAHTAHTTEPVPLVYVGRLAQFNTEPGSLADVAPTLLSIMDLPQPSEMAGKSLLQMI